MVYMRRAAPTRRTGPAKRLILAVSMLMLAPVGQSLDDGQYVETGAAPAPVQAIESSPLSSKQPA